MKRIRYIKIFLLNIFFLTASRASYGQFYMSSYENIYLHQTKPDFKFQKTVEVNKRFSIKDSLPKMTLPRVFLGANIRPALTFETLSKSSYNVRMGWYYTAGFASLYSITAGLLYSRKWEPNPDFPPFLPISSDKYYLYQSFFTLPVGIAGVGIANYSALGMSRFFGSNVKSNELWGPISVASTVPYFFFTWVPETFYHPWQEPGTILFSPQVEASRQIIAGVWCTGLIIVAVKKTTKLPWWKSAIIGTISTAAMGTFMLTFYR